MSIKSFAAKIFAKVVKAQIDSWANNPLKAQEKVFNQLIKQAQHTQFGQDHQFSKIKNQQDFSNLVPVKDYEALKPYIERVKQGEQDILWPGRPIYFAKTSGTTSGAKYIPITKESMPSHIKGARNAILSYINETGNSDFVNGKMIFLQGSPVLQEENGIKVGRLSGIVAHFVPRYLQKNRMPSWEVNCIEDWETKVEAIINETISADMRVFSGIPSWLQMYFERLQERTGKTITDIFPNFNLLIYGGVNFEPYRPKFESLIGKPINSIELFPASEGFFAYQDSQKEKGMLLRLDAGIYYEFIEADSFFEENPKRIGIADVALGVNYVMIISTNAGLWAYNLGDTVIFTSLKPYRVLVSGRIKHFTSAFGEHVIAKEVEEALQQAVAKHRVEVSEFSVAPQTNPETGLPYHEWFIEFNKQPDNLTTFAQSIDEALQNQNSYYQDLIQGKILKTLVISPVVENGFQRYMKAIGKLGGQNKLPRLTNDRLLADKLYELKLVETNDE